MSQDPRNRRASTNRRIYEVAIRLFLERGYDAVSVGEIAAAAGVSVPTFYAHFTNKENVVLPLPDRPAVQAALAGRTFGVNVFPELRDAILDWLASYQGRDLEDLLERWQIVIATPGLRLRAAEYERATATIVLEAMPPASVAPGQLLATELVVIALFSSYTLTLLRWAEEGGTRTLVDVADEVLTTLRDLGGPPG
ncbi:TetR/AcrR family transcriptional regulator [Trujillonella endophytica]|uniref:Transcriptional regulator, TetR family n=1 Tax=Trujillonella endophytica TaxID=673521 RepID=A0A1H8VD74_9ACTN|nr:TetR/AcrR family transcriptional regulator [Trujillella endophytica]SEP13127.1 transcriptional regulator, TetR family [Trujillella endophytica]